MLRLTLRDPPRVPVEAPCITPNYLCRLAPAEIARQPVQWGNQRAAVGDVFDVTGDASDAAIEIAGDCSRVKWLGARMTAGKLTIRGPAGMHAGSGLRGGELTIDGDADDWLGAEMRGGLIRVRGRAGDHAGGAYPGSQAGMRGGVLLIDGAAGAGAGAVMRRGLIACGGAGDFAAASMVAGSLFIFGSVGRYAGAEMKRGTIAALGRSPELLPSFQPSCIYQPVFLHLYLRRLLELNFDAVSTFPVRPLRRYCGDLVSCGLGEILIPAGDVPCL